MDGAEVTRNTEILFYSFSSLTVQASANHPLDSVFLCAGIPYCVMKLKGMKDRVMTLLANFTAWNLRVLRGGALPSRGFYNEEFRIGTASCERAHLGVVWCKG